MKRCNAKRTEGAAIVSLAGKTAIVTGSGQGLGLAYARELARQGASVVVNDVDAAAAEAAVATIIADGGAAVAVVAPVGSAETADALVAAAVEHFGRLDILVTNAGILRDTVLWKMSDDDFDKVIAVHLRGTFTCVRAAATHFREAGHGGRIICIGSPTGQRGNFGQTNYAAAKAGIVGMVRTWAMELKKAEVTVNTVIPVAATAMTATVPYFAAAVEADAAGEPMPAFFRHDLGFGTADDVAGLIAYLGSDAAAGVTGQAIGVGGDRLQLWSHPEPVATEYRDGGWTYEALVDGFASTFGDKLQSVGESFPQLPDELRREPAAS
jgi:NAD(P)-dependent dehydrogenase (short-subunit alcohol dehydrogenase family)